MRLHQVEKISQNIFINLFVNYFKTASGDAQIIGRRF